MSSQIESASPNETITLDKDYYWDGSGNYIGIELNKTITIDGQGHTIDAESADGGYVRIFNIYGTDIVLKNIVFANADRNYNQVGGGAIYVFEGATVSIINCTFVNNTAAFGGAINSYGGVNITDCIFYNNSVTYNGGAIVGSAETPGFTGAYLHVTNSKFYNNSAGYGGAILGGYESNVTIADSEFINNSARYNGGALDFTTYVTPVYVSNSIFKNNRANNGGAIYLATAEPIVIADNCVFENNNAINNGGVVYANDDSPYPSIYDITFNKCDINGNSAKNGAVVYADDNLVGTNVTIISSNVINNTADSFAIGYMGEGSKIAIINSNVSDNEANDNTEIKGTSVINFSQLEEFINQINGSLTLNSDVVMTEEESEKYVSGITIDKDLIINGNGFKIDANNLGAIFNVTNRATLTLNNITLTNAIANNGAVVYATTANVNIYNSVITNNSATGFTYGIIAAIISSNVNIVNTTFSDNINLIYQVGGTLNIDSSEFINNDGKSSSTDLIFSGGADTTINNSEFIGNDGTMIFNNNGGSVIISDSIFKNQTGSEAVYNNANGHMEIINTEFINCEEGAAFNNGKGYMLINGSNFVNNSGAGGSAGAIFSNSNSKLEIYDSNFINNSAISSGGAIFINGASEIYIENTEFTDNSASSSGDAIYVNGANANLTIADSIFTNNNVESRGDVNFIVSDFTHLENAINAVDDELVLGSDVTMTDAEADKYKDGITINKDITIDAKGHTIDANELGRIFNIVNSATLTLNNAVLINGRADKGGAIYNDGTLNINNVTLKDNAAENWGGAIYDNGVVTVANSTFDGNDIINRGSSSTDYGGAAIFSNGDLKVDNSVFTNNIKNYENGDYLTGAITSYGDVTVTNSYFANNSGRWGAAFSSADYNNQDLVTIIDNCTFIDNRGLYGPGIWSWGTDFSITDSTFTDNTAFGKGNMTPNNNNGGAIAVYGATSTGVISGSTFIGNNAQYGGAIYISENMGIIIQNSKFTNNSAQYGGAIGVSTGGSGSNNVSIIDSEFTTNTADNGGAIFNTEELNVTDSTFTDNTGVNGSVIYTKGNLELNGNIYEFEGDNAPIYVVGDVINTQAVITVLNNETVYVGWGEIFNLTATVTVDGAYVSSNTVYFLIDGEKIAAQSLGNGSYVAQYTPNVLGTYTVYADINDMENTVNAGSLEVERLTPEFTIEVNDTSVYDIAVIKGNISSQATGNVLIYVNGRFAGVAEIRNGTFEFNYMVQNAVNYYVTAVYEGNSNISGASANDDFNGLKISFTPNIMFIMDGNNVFINITGIPTYGVTVSIVLDQGYIINPIDGCYILSVEDMPYGNYSAGIYIWGDNYHTASYIYPVHINPIEVDISLSLNSTLLYVGDSVQIIADVVGLEEGNITFNVNNVLYTAAVNNGQAIIELDGLTAGSYSVIANYAGDYIHESAISNMVNFEIKQDSSSKLESSTIVDVENVSTAGNPVINIIATVSNGTGNVTFRVNGVEIGVVDLVNGHAMIEYVPATPGEFVVEAVYNGDFVYKSSSDNSTFTVERAPTDISIDINVSEDNANITVKLPEDATGNIIVSIGNSTIEVPLVNGSANVTLKDLAIGNNTINVTYNGDDYYAPATESDIVEITVLKAVLTADDIVMIYRDGTRLEMVLTDIGGNPLANQIVYITINGVTYNRTTDSNGHASIAINLAPNEYVVNIEFRDGVTYASTQTLASVTVISSIEGSDVVKYFRNGTQYYATFYGSDGKPLANTNVTFNINGVFYTRQTNENGTARLNINLNPGQYIITAINPVNGQHYSNNITVLPTISAVDVVKYFRNGTQYDVTVLDAQGAPAVNQTVKFNINGVFYYRQTDENGTARLSINLNSGEYVVTASANGLSVSNNITILPTIYGEELVKDFNEVASYNVTVVDGQGNPVVNQTVTMNINGVFYNRVTDEDGVARLNINLGPGEYIITSYYGNATLSNKITVKQP